MANPPVVGLALSRSLGFIVIGRLAQRFGITVRMTSSPVGRRIGTRHRAGDARASRGDSVPRSDVAGRDAWGDDTDRCP